MSKVSLRLKLTDFMNTDIEELVMNRIESIHKELYVTILLYLWFEEDEMDPKLLKTFLSNWEEKLSYKTVIKQGPNLNTDDFIWFDIAPIGIEHSNLKRFEYLYADTSKIIDGLQEFYNIIKFTLSDKPIRKQKRNDYED